ncbi:hypothetical protein V2J09_002611 [Rumex salicifolius]
MATRSKILIPLLLLLLINAFAFSSNAAKEPAANKKPEKEPAADKKPEKEAADKAAAPESGKEAAAAPESGKEAAAAPKGGAIDITTLGAKPGADAAPAMNKAWEQACACTEPTKIVVPKGNYSLSCLSFLGPCKAPITIEIAGNFEAPKTMAELKGSDSWIKIERVGKLTIIGKEGGGVFDGNGEDGWKNNRCESTGVCGTLPYNMRLFYVNDSVIDGITSLDSRQFHMNLINVYNFTVQNVKIIAPGDARNTDGIHIGRSQGVKIIDTSIKTGDDCISIGDGTKNLTIEKVTCGPGHGISIGSLGRYDNEDDVEGITVSQCTFTNTDNGVRIKSWLNSKVVAVRDVRFEDITMENVTYPILIDQAYCPAAHCDASIPSKVKISNIVYKNIKGTAADPSVMRLVCSKSCPCENIHVEDIDLKYSGRLGPTVSECCNVKPESAGKVNPPACAAVTTEAEASDHITAGIKFVKAGSKSP